MRLKICTIEAIRQIEVKTKEGSINEAKSRSEEILRQAKDGSKRSMGEVDVYAMQILTQLEQTLQQNLQQIQQAKSVVGH